MKVEVCCGSYADAYNAYLGGANRVELCSSLFFGGLTPSLATLRLTKLNLNLETAVMLRARQAGFCYSNIEQSVMQEDARIFIDNGADSLVFGFLTSKGEIDFASTKKMVDIINGRCKCVFHRAYDASISSAEQDAVRLKEIGIDRILTSGKAVTAQQGKQTIKRLVELNLLEIVACGKIRKENLQEIVKFTNCSYVHISAFEERFDASNNGQIKFCKTTLPQESSFDLVSVEKVKEIVELTK
ncbi:MAG: copper homeostasis protein CutC [Clostridia bacterium]